MAAARELFAARGYASVAAEEIVQRAGVTRGALYHHFRGKDALSRAVYEQTEREVTERIAAGAVGAADPIELLRTGAATFLDACLEPRSSGSRSSTRRPCSDGRAGARSASATGWD
jgi:AcrR family transcriptional regulator